MTSHQASPVRQRRTRNNQPIFTSNFVPSKSPVRRTPLIKQPPQDLSKLNLSRDEMKTVISKMAEERGELLRTIRRLGGRSSPPRHESTQACQTETKDFHELGNDHLMVGDGFVPRLASDAARLEEATAQMISKMEALTSAVERHCDTNR